MKVYSQTLTADGDTSVYSVRNSREFQVEKVGYSANGTWDSGTLTLYVCQAPDASTRVYSPVSTVALTADGAGIFDVMPGCVFKLTLSGAGVSADIDIDLRGYIYSE